MRMQFGRYRGLELEKVPADYLVWLYRQSASTRKSIHRELISRGLLDQESENEQEHRHNGTNIPTDPSALFDELVEEGFRALAKKLHPDKGGNTERMQERTEFTARQTEQCKRR